MPHAIEAAGDSGDGGEEGVGHPDGKDGVLLPYGLTCCNVVACGVTYAAAYGELYPTATQGDEGDAEKRGQCHVAVHDGARSDSDGHSERHGPEIEGGVARVLQTLGKARHRVAYSPGEQQRTDERREHLADDKDGGGEEGLPLVWINERHDEGNEQCCREVDEQDIGDEVGGMASELGTDHCSSTRRGADEAYHGALHEQAAGQHGKEDEHGSTQSKDSYLHEQ